MNRKLLTSLTMIAALALYLVLSNIRCPRDIPSLAPWPGSADEISIHGPGTAVTLVRAEGKWLVGEKKFPADAKLVADLEKRFKEIRLVSLVSRKGFFSRYDLTPDRYREVSVKKNGAVFRKFIIGKTGTTGRHTYVRIDDTPAVYLAEGTFEQDLGRGPDDYRDREIVKISPEAIASIEINYLGRSYRFEKVAAPQPAADARHGKKEKGAAAPQLRQWTCASCGEGFQADQGRLDSLAMAFNPLTAASFPDIQKETLKNPLCTVTVNAFGKDIVLTIFGKKGNIHAAACSENPYVFNLDDWRVNGFFLTGTDSFKKRTEAERR